MTATRILFFLVAAVAVGACDSNKPAGTIDAGSGGTASTGGAPGSGGAPASGGHGMPVATGGSGTGGQGGQSGQGGQAGGAARIPTRHRPEHLACGANPMPMAATCTPVGTQGTADSTCSLDAQCTEGTNGRCIQYATGESNVRCRCTYTQCQADQDCPSAGACRCGGNEPNAWGNTCLEGNCQVDGDCGAGGFCSPTRARDTPRADLDRPTAIVGTYCHTPEDQCVNDEECGPVPGSGYCAYSGVQHRWTCIDLLLQ